MANEMIRFENVHKWFKDLHVINGVNLNIAKGEVVVVCGPSGSGKSTLIRTVNQLETIQDGNIYVDGVGVNDHKTDLNKLRAEVGFVFQSFNLYPHLTAIENIMLSPMKVKKMGAAEAKTLADCTRSPAPLNALKRCSARSVSRLLTDRKSKPISRTSQH